MLTRAPRPVRSVVETLPICTGRPHSCDIFCACSCALEVRIESSTNESTIRATTTTAATMATIFCQRFIGAKR